MSDRLDPIWLDQDYLDRLVIRINAGAEPQIYDWLGFDASGALVSHGHDVALPAARVLELAIPAAWLTVHSIALPVVSSKQRQLLLMQALEDRVLGKLSELHWLAGPIVEGKTTVWVLEKTRLAALQAWVAASGLAFVRWVPEFALLPGESTYASSSSGILFRTASEWGCLESETELLALYPESSWQSVATTQLQAPSKEAVSFYQAKKVLLATNWLDWRRAIYLLIVCLAVFLLSLVLQWRSLANQESALRQEIRQTFASIFPGVPIVDPILQWQSRQNAGAAQSGSGGDALDLLYKTAAQIDLEAGVDSISVKEGKVQILLDEAKAAALLAKLTAQGVKVQSNKLADGRMSIEVQP
ncbi:type II secretion system protein GspL [Deefgea rivuli]|uniref:type II secretion system protein GspL n=1 Tax=Deefgea rivuli TaxID=400948 RepID=UPI00047FF54A|nr:type II secretion system protein GspL [Deefgea rivuli]